MNWKCPKCGTINSSQSTSACCINCGSSKWATFTVEPQNWCYCNDCPEDEWCPTKKLKDSNARLKAELEITKTALQSGVKMILQLHEDCDRLNKINEDWYRFAKAIGEIVKCLPSTFPAENEHITKRVVELKESNSRLKALLGDLWVAYVESFDYKRKKLIPEFKARINKEEIE
jgi:hypothetical protein